MELKVIEEAAPGASEVRRAYERLRAAARREPDPSLAARHDRLDRLITLVQTNREAIAEAISQDFGGRSRHETLLADVFPTIDSARHARRQLARWMKPRTVSPSWLFRPGRARVQAQPLGVVGIVAPWNYPVNLALAPLAAALAAGNRALVKPSELTPRTAALLAQLVRQTFTPDEVAVVTGGPDVAREVTELPLDHLLFTGSTRVGREVARAAANNLTPVTLELGGKSPALVHPDYPLARAAERIAAGKLFNAGQTCIAPDYALVPAGSEEAFATHFRRAVHARYPLLATNPDYSAIATTAGLERLRALVAEAAAKGARVETILPGGPLDPSSRKLAPALVFGADDSMRLLQEEIFGPLLPVIPYRTLDEAIAYVNGRARPLAFYYFDSDAARARAVLRRTLSGGACVNETLLHFVQENLPFGGVGESGSGAYHGRTGFETFSHRRAVFVASEASPTSKLLGAPYGKLLERALDAVIGGRRRRPGE